MREPDELIGDPRRPLIRRWYFARKWRIKLLENVYLHQVMRSDDDRALHDHPWWNISIVLKGGYYEHMPLMPVAYRTGWDRREITRWRGRGSIVFRRAAAPHRLVLPEHAPVETWTLFITGKKSREWGFLCLSGWRHWKFFSVSGCGK